MKKRHVKKIHEKWEGSVLERVEVGLKESGNIAGMEEEIYDELPYIGIMYVPLNHEFGTFWYDSDDTTQFLRVKVIETSENKVTIAHYDSHHHNIVILDNIDTTAYAVEGNILIKYDWTSR